MFIEIAYISNEAQEKLKNLKAKWKNSQINQFIKKSTIEKGSQIFPVQMSDPWF